MVNTYGLSSVIEDGIGLVTDNAGAILGGAVLGGAVVGTTVAIASSRKKKTSKRTPKKRRKSKSRKSKKKRYTPYTAGKRKDKSTRRIRMTKTGQPYVILASGKARFISKSSAKASRRRKGGRY